MANSTISLISSLTMIALFCIAIIGFAVSFANDNNAAVRIDDDAGINSLKSDADDSMRVFTNDTTNAYSSISNTTLETGSDVIKSPAVFTLTWGNLFSTFANILGVIFIVVFGGNPAFAIFTTALVALLGLMFTLYIIKAWRGNP